MAYRAECVVNGKSNLIYKLPYQVKLKLVYKNKEIKSQWLFF